MLRLFRNPLAPVLMASMLLALSAALVSAESQRNFVAPLNADEEVPTNDSRARGVAIFQLSADGTELSYRLIASNIENVHMAHIHCCVPAGENAGVVVWLYPSTAPGPGAPDSGRHDGVLATGTITENDLVGAFSGQPLSVLIDAIVGGDAYVNVHTASTTIPEGQPGNLPGGEIRGQLP